MSGHTRTEKAHLTLARTSEGASHDKDFGRLALHPSEPLTRFLAKSAQAGLDAPEAVRLGLERALVLEDAARLAPDVEAGRRQLVSKAAQARARREMTPTQAARVRALSAGRPTRTADASQGLKVKLPDKLISRTHGTVPQSALHPGAVEEMVSWELAATLAGRTMGEWALLVLAEERTAANAI